MLLSSELEVVLIMHVFDKVMGQNYSCHSAMCLEKTRTNKKVFAE